MRLKIYVFFALIIDKGFIKFISHSWNGYMIITRFNNCNLITESYLAHLRHLIIYFSTFLNWSD